MMGKAFALTLGSFLFAILLAPGAADARGRGPSGIFRNSSGMVKLAYQGEGMVSLVVKTRYCSYTTTGGRTAGTFVPKEGIAAYDAQGKPVLVAFYRSKKLIVYASFERFKKRYCKGGFDVTGSYRRRRK